jgi:hypothetical protein
MPLADLFISSEETARAGAKNVSAPGRESSPDSNRIDVKGFDLIPLTTLLCLLTGRKWEVNVLDDFPVIHEGSKDGPWVRSVSPSLVELLVVLSPGQFRKAVAAWSQSDELRELEGRRPGITKQVLADIVNLVRKAKATGQNVFLWECL